jgi:hypothetical protein
MISNAHFMHEIEILNKISKKLLGKTNNKYAW